MTSAGTPRWLALLGIVLALALPAVLMACGGDAPDANGERATATPRTEAASTPAAEAAASTPMPGDAPTATKAPLLTIGPTSVETDREALVALYNATDGPNWNRRSNWLSDAPLGEWVGVYTDDDGRVTELSLGLLLGQFLSGNRLSGEIPPELGSLTNLRVLRLDDNALSGEIPPELGSLSYLEWLNLSGNRLNGEIPPELGSLTNLEVLDLGDNHLWGEIPAELGSLSYLTDLALTGNELSGEIPAELGSLSYLERLNLSNNGGLSGEIPAELGSLSYLTSLVLNNNGLSGEIPAELGSLANLEQLYLSQNQLSGCAPASLRRDGLRVYLQGQLDMTTRDFGDLPFC